jgi:hypothetical protein
VYGAPMATSNLKHPAIALSFFSCVSWFVVKNKSYAPEGRK